MFADPDDPTIVEINWYGFEAAGGNPPPDAAATKGRLHDEFPDAIACRDDRRLGGRRERGRDDARQFDDAIDGAAKGGLLSADEAAAAGRARVITRS